MGVEPSSTPLGMSPMDPGFHTPLVDLFQRGGVDVSLRLQAARGTLTPRAHEQLALLILLLDDADPAVAQQARHTMAALPVPELSVFLARPDVPDAMREFFAARGVTPRAPGDQPHASATTEGETVSSGELEPADDADGQAGAAEDGEAPSGHLSSLSVNDRMKLARKGTREERAQLVRDPNRMVATAVLSSPKLTEAEVESFAKMTNVSEDVLRSIAGNRAWVKNYGVMAGLARNPKTPPGVSMPLLHRLSPRDVKIVAADRNVPEALRLAAKRIVARLQK
jgi:hypothetical protein